MKTKSNTKSGKVQHEKTDTKISTKTWLQLRNLSNLKMIVLKLAHWKTFKTFASQNEPSILSTIVLDPLSMCTYFELLSSFTNLVELNDGL